MSATPGNYSKSLDRNSEGTPCRLCMKKNDHYYNIFTSILASQITVEDALYDLVDLKVAVGDGLPATLCPLCLKKLIEFYDFRNICHKSDAELRKFTSRNDFRSDPVMNKCSSVKNDQISDDEEQVVNDCSDGATTKQMYQDYSNQPITLTASQGEKVEAQGAGAVVVDLEWTVIGEKKEASLEENDQLSLGEDGDPIERSTVAHESTTEAYGVSAANEIPIQTTSTSYLPVEGNVRNFSIDECTGPSAFVTQIDSNAGASVVNTERNVMDEDMEKCGTPDTDMKTNSSIPGDRQCNARNDESHKIIGTGGEKTYFGEKGGFDAPNTTNSLRNIRLNRNERNGCETAMGNNEEMPNCSIKNPGNSCRSNQNSFHCFNCRDAFNDKNELIEHMKIHFVARNFDAVPESMGDVSLKTLPSHKYSSSCELTTSNTSYGLERTKLDPTQKGNVPIKETTGGKRDKKNMRRMTRSFTLAGESTSQSLSSISSRIKKQCNRVGTGEKERPYSCSVCAKGFTRKGDLIRHERMHTGDRPYSCNVCGKSYTRCSNLRSHVCTDTGKTPFSCNECEKSFSSNYHLMRHVRMHTGERPYSCSECEKSFSNGSDLVRHARIHTREKPYSCSVCPKSFSQKGNLNVHIRTHAAKGPFSCNECGKSFSNKYNLITHIRTHTGDRPYSCSVCSKCFTRKYILAAHIRTHKEGGPFGRKQSALHIFD